MLLYSLLLDLLNIILNGQSLHSLVLFSLFLFELSLLFRISGDFFGIEVICGEVLFCVLDDFWQPR